MSGSTVGGPAASAPPRLITPALARLFLATFGAMVSICLLLSVVPLYVTSGGASGVGAGAATGALLLSTVAAELAVPRLVARFGYRLVFAVGLLLLGAPALALAGSVQLLPVIVVSVVRGIGFGIVVVLGSALVAILVPPQRRGEGLGLHGVSVGLPAVLALPLGVFLVGQVGYLPVFVAGAVAALVGLVLVPGLPGRDHPPGQADPPAAAAEPDRRPVGEQPVGILAGLRDPALLRPAVVFAATAMAGGAVVTFLPLAVSAGAGKLAAVGLFLQAAAATLARWWAGRFGDRHGPIRLIIPALLAAAAGMLLLVLLPNPVVLVVAMLLFGAGFGVSQNASLALMFSRVSRSGYGMVSAVWNLAYDAGMGLGAASFGVLATQAGYPAGFALTGALMLVLLLLAWRDRVATGSARRRVT